MAPAPNFPKVMGRFRCEERLGGEGPFETFRARVGGLGGFDHVYALTALTPGALGRRPHAAEGLLRAARAAGTVKDPRVAAVLESGLAPGSAFVVAEFVHGITLRELIECLENGSVSLPVGASWAHVVAALGADIAGGLAAAHALAAPVVHGALSLSNVMLTPQGTVKLLDFGLYAAVHTPAEIAQAPSRRGLTAPELGGGGGFAPAADVFALGAVLQRLWDVGAATTAAKTTAASAAGGAAEDPLLSLLRALMAPDTTQRPGAGAAESALRDTVKDARGNPASELAALVRFVIRQRPTPEALQTAGGQPTNGAAYDETAGDVPSLFADEPTAVVDVTAESKSASMAAILRELRGQEREDETAEFMDQAAARAAAAGLIHAEGALPDSGATRLGPLPLTAVPLAMPMYNTPLGGFLGEPPPGSDDAVMDDGPSSTPTEGEATMVSTAAPSLADLAMTSEASAEFFLPFSDDGEDGEQDGEPNRELDGEPGGAGHGAREDLQRQGLSASGRIGAGAESPGAGSANAGPAGDVAVAPPQPPSSGSLETGGAWGARGASGPVGSSGVWEQIAVGGSLSDTLPAAPVPAPTSSAGVVASGGSAAEAAAPSPTNLFETSDFSGVHESAARLQAALVADSAPAGSDASASAGGVPELGGALGGLGKPGGATAPGHKANDIPQAGSPSAELADLTSARSPRVSPTRAWRSCVPPVKEVWLPPPASTGPPPEHPKSLRLPSSRPRCPCVPSSSASPSVKPSRPRVGAREATSTAPGNNPARSQRSPPIESRA